jgi:hypothetical protein
MDAAVSVVQGGVQHSLHASRLAPAERGETRVGPIAVEVIEPLRSLRVRVAPNPSGLEGDLHFHARARAIEEPRFRRVHEGRVMMDSTRLTQFGSWDGSLSCSGTRHTLDRARHLGCRDRSWGVRPVGEREVGAPGPAPQYFWLWAPLHFDDRCAHFDVNEEADGARWHAFGTIVPALASDASPQAPLPAGGTTMERVAHAVAWQPGTRRARSARIRLGEVDGSSHEIALEPILTFQMLGLGYLHPEWGHGLWKGEEAMATASWKLADCAPLDPRHLHVQQLCRATWAGRSGVGVLEQLVIGPHAPSGLRGLLDPAPEASAASGA